MTTSFHAWRQAIDQTLAHHLETISNSHLRQAMTYSVMAGGKRLRPLLVLATVDSYAKPVETALPAAGAIEFVHTYSLIHDDLPAMDNDDLRRGRATNHRQFGEAIAILAGDGLLTDAFAWLAAAYPKHSEIVATLAQAAGASGMVAGQVMDIDGQTKHYSLEALSHLHALKTGALIRAAVALGASISNAPTDQRGVLDDFAAHFGLAFQIKDDIDDVTKTSAQLGKTANKDVAAHKNTFPALLGLANAKAALQHEQAAAQMALEQLERPAPRLAELLALLNEENV